MPTVIGPVRCSSGSRTMKCTPSHALTFGKPSYSGEEAVFGTAFHALIARVVQGTGGSQADVSLCAAKHGLPPEQVDDLGYLIHAVKIDFTDWTVITEKEFGVDYEFNPCDPESPQCILRGHPDLVAFSLKNNGVVQIKDWKSGYQEIDQWQLILYALLVAAHYPEAQTFYIQYVYPRLRKIVERTTPSGDARPYSRSELIDLWMVVRDRLILATQPGALNFGKDYTTGAHCAGCRPWECPAWADWRKLLQTDPTNALAIPSGAAGGSYATNHEVKDILVKVRILKRAIDSGDEFCKNYIIGNGPLDLGDGTEYANRPTERVSFDAAKSWPGLVKIAGSEKGAVNAFIKALGYLSKEKLKDFCKIVFLKPRGKAKELFDVLDAIGATETKPQDRFSVFPKNDSGLTEADNETQEE